MTDGKRPTRDSLRQSSVKPTGFRCPCCGYPTLRDPHRFTTCGLCAWDNDGQDDPFADEVWGGPNGSFGLSLSRARDNFRHHLSKYDADDPMSEPYSLRVTEAKSAMAAFEEMKGDLPIGRYEELCRRVLACKQMLLEELGKSAYDDEWQKERTKQRRAYWERRYGSEQVKSSQEQIAQLRKQMDAARAHLAGRQVPKQ